MGYQNFKNNIDTNGKVHIWSNIIKNVMELSAESEVVALFHNGQELETIRTTLKKWDTPNLQHQFKLTITLYMAWPMANYVSGSDLLHYFR